MATTTRTVSCSPEAVFDVLADGWLYPSWVVGASRIRDVEAAWPAPGAKIHHSFGVWPALIDDSTSVLECEASERGCEVSISEDAVEGPGTLVPKAVRDPLIGVRNVETLRRLEYL